DGFSRLYYSYEWEKASLPAKPEQAGSHSMVLFATEETLRDVYQEQMAKAGKGSGQLILVQPGDSFEDSGKQSYKINPKSKHDFERLFECFIEKQISLENICFAWPVRQAQWRNANSVNDSLERGIYSFLFLCQSLIKQGLENKVQLL